MERSGLDLPAALFLRGFKRDWQLLCIAVLGLATLGIGLAIFGMLRVGVAGWQLGDYSAFLPPLLHGFVSLVLLIALYFAQKQGVMAALDQELLHQKMEAELNRELALLDPITEVYNRRYLRPMLVKEVSRASRHDQPLSVIMFDVTGFQRVNDSLGMNGGDLVLRQIAQLAQAMVRNSDYVVRFGGTEFLLLLPDTNQDAAAMLGRRLQRSFAEWSEQRGMSGFGLVLAIGVGEYEGGSADEMLNTAKKHMR